MDVRNGWENGEDCEREEDKEEVESCGHGEKKVI